ncbi:MAG: acetaldehyde dehydrogenase (acetylating) [Cellvibrionales bacterium TMED122]|nr:acetaldehyde dehydrogenase (acetylating) [Halieaceae bacterium]OUV63509.1 MAG: acetaldehyde dehydrogenase (acetylating) [Cellvibrionales bacterium TMED122]
MADKLKALVIGPGNIGTDLLMKARRSEWIEPIWVVGVEQSEGIQRAQDMGVKTCITGIDGVLQHIVEDDIRIAFDATSAYAHADHAQKLNDLGVIMVDLTPAAIGPFCVPPVNLAEHSALLAMNVNMVTCGGQATIPMVHAVSRVQSVAYGEIVATVGSKSVGPGTRKNIDEFTRTTSAAVAEIGGAREGKAIIIINPAEPPLIMRDTVHCLVDDEPDQDAIIASVHAMVEEVQKYVPGYRLVNGPVFDGKRVSTFLEVEGLGDFLPKYAGNLDIMTAAGLRTAEMLAEEVANSRFALPARA